jgi:hypothetical protein
LLSPQVLISTSIPEEGCLQRPTVLAAFTSFGRENLDAEFPIHTIAPYPVS